MTTGKTGLGHHDPDLVEVSGRGEGGERNGNRSKAGRRQSRRYSDHVLLGNAHLKEASRYRVGEQVSPRRVAQIAVQDNDTRVSRLPSSTMALAKASRILGNIIGHSTAPAVYGAFSSRNDGRSTSLNDAGEVLIMEGVRMPTYSLPP